MSAEPKPTPPPAATPAPSGDGPTFDLATINPAGEWLARAKLLERHQTMRMARSLWQSADEGLRELIAKLPEWLGKETWDKIGGELEPQALALLEAIWTAIRALESGEQVNADLLPGCPRFPLKVAGEHWAMFAFTPNEAKIASAPDAAAALELMATLDPWANEFPGPAAK